MFNRFFLLLTPLLVACSYKGQIDSSSPLRDDNRDAQQVQLVQPSQAFELPAAAKIQTVQSSQNNASAITTGLTKQALPKASAMRVSLKDSLGPANMCDGAITHNERVLIPPVAKPPFRKYYKDPAFGSRVIRITDSPVGVVQKPAYSTMQAWNADESLMLIYHGGTQEIYHQLLDGHTYEPVRKLDIVPSDLEEVYWSHTDPDVFYYVSGYSRDVGLFKKYSVSKGKAEVVADFSKYCGVKGLPTGGGDVQMQSMDDDLWGFRCRLNQTDYIMLSYRISTKEVISKKIGKGTPWQEWTAPSPTPSGDRYWYQGTALGLDIETVEKKMDMYKWSEHASVGLTYNGQDAIFAVGFNPVPNGCNGDIWQGVGHLIEHNLETGGCRPIINEELNYPYTTKSTHVSAKARLRPGWIAMSSIGAGDDHRFFSNKRKAPALLSEIYLADTHPKNMVTCRLAHHRSFGKAAKRGGYPAYFGEPHATISPSGTRILFGSDWYDSGSVDSYVVELPGYKKPQ